MPLQTCRALKFPSGSSQNLLLCAGGALPVGPAWVHARPCLCRGGRWATWAALFSCVAAFLPLLSSLPPPGPVREEPHCCHLCSCAVRKCFYVLWKKRQLNIFWTFSINLSHKLCCFWSGKEVVWQLQVSLLRARGIANCRNVLGHYTAESKDLQLRDRVQQPLLLTLSRQPCLP